MLARSIGGFGIGIGIIECSKNLTCNKWDTEALDTMKNLLSIHDIIAGIWVFGCVLWKILIPLWSYIKIIGPLGPTYEGEFKALY